MGLIHKLKKNLYKFNFYSLHALNSLVPSSLLRIRRKNLIRMIEGMSEVERRNVWCRVNYYNKVESGFLLPDDAIRSRFFKREKSWAYYLDLFALLRYFSPDNYFLYEFGDVTEIPDNPSFVKSRPIDGNNRNSVLLKFNKVRHYYFVKDRFSFDAKQDRVVWRGACHQPHRRRFIESFHDHPLCDVGDVHRKADGKPWHRSFMPVADQLKYKFILSIEGNDVATNLKWIMASNSLCFMTRPRYETWFMEGLLVPGYHYVLLKEDYSDLEEKVAYYSLHQEEAKRIIHNANEHAAQFMDHRNELLVSLLVMQKYFEQSGQW